MPGMGWTLKICEVRPEAPPVQNDLQNLLNDRKIGYGELHLVSDVLFFHLFTSHLLHHLIWT